MFETGCKEMIGSRWSGKKGNVRSRFRRLYIFFLPYLHLDMEATVAKHKYT